MSTNQIRLDELLARQVEVQWYEGVAIVQAICHQLLAQGVSNSEFPAATQIGIRTDGTVRVLGTMPAQAVQAAAHLLAGMLSDDVPVRLRLVVSQATGESSTIENLRELSETLKYFERPDSELIVRNLLERAMLASFRKQADEPAPEEAFPTERPQTARPQEQKKAQWRLPAMAAAGAIVVTAGLIWFTSRGDRVSAAYSGITNVLGGGSEARPNEPVEKAGTPKETAPKGATPQHRALPPTATDADRKSGEPRKERPAVVAGRIPSLAPSASSAKLPMLSVDGSKSPQPEQTYVIYASEPGVSASDPVYSKADAAVTPPRQVYPALPAEPAAAALKDALTVVDLIVATDGLVERVHLRTPPRTIHEFMLLSAVKAWRFQPALLDGRPVRFRHSVALTSFQ